MAHLRVRTTAMPDNTAKIKKIDAILEAGATSVTIEGVTTTFDFDQLREQRRLLQQADTATGHKRPIFGGIDLSKAF